MTPRHPLLINCSAMGGVPNPEPFFSRHLGARLRWQFVDASRGGPWSRLRRLPVPNPARLRGGFETAARAVYGRADLVVSHDPRVTLACEFFLRRLQYAGPHLAFSFNLPAIPSGVQLRLMKAAFSRVDRFLVYSTVERRLYHEAFGIPLERLDFHHWAVNPPRVQPDARPLVGGDYVCAIGGNARDYATLLKAAQAVRHVRFVIVARPENLAGLSPPPNVEVRANIPLADAMNILAFSRFMTLPLAGGEVPCGHVTLVSAMHLGKAVVVSNSAGVADYVEDGVTALTCQPFSADAMAAAVSRLWGDPALCYRLARAGKAFAGQHCTESAMLDWFTRYLTGKGLLSAERSAESHTDAR